MGKFRISIFIVILLALVSSGYFIFGWRPATPHRVAARAPAPRRAAPEGIIELDRSHYWVKDGFATNAWHLCEHGVKKVDHSTEDSMANFVYGQFQLKGGAVLVCKSDNSDYLFTNPNGGN